MQQEILQYLNELKKMAQDGYACAYFKTEGKTGSGPGALGSYLSGETWQAPGGGKGKKEVTYAVLLCREDVPAPLSGDAVDLLLSHVFPRCRQVAELEDIYSLDDPPSSKQQLALIEQAVETILNPDQYSRVKMGLVR